MRCPITPSLRPTRSAKSTAILQVSSTPAPSAVSPPRCTAGSPGITVRLQNWNDGKAQEFKDRKLYDLGNSHLKPGHHPANNAAAAEAAPAVPAGNKESAHVMLFTTSSCPKCKVAGSMLDSAHLPFERIVADADDASREMARSFGIRQAPTLVVERTDRSKLMEISPRSSGISKRSRTEPD